MTYHIDTAWAYSKDLTGLFHKFLNSTASLIPICIKNKPVQLKVQFFFKSQAVYFHPSFLQQNSHKLKHKHDDSTPHFGNS